MFESDYLKTNDYIFNKKDIKELFIFISILENEIKNTNYHFHIYSLFQIFFYSKNKFKYLSEGFQKLKDLSLNKEIKNSSDYLFFISGMIENFKNYLNNIQHNQNIHYYDSAFLADIEQFESRLFGIEEPIEIDFF